MHSQCLVAFHKEACVHTFSYLVELLVQPSHQDGALPSLIVVIRRVAVHDKGVLSVHGHKAHRNSEIWKAALRWSYDLRPSLNFIKSLFRTVSVSPLRARHSMEARAGTFSVYIIALSLQAEGISCMPTWTSHLFCTPVMYRGVMSARHFMLIIIMPVACTLSLLLDVTTCWHFS